MKNRFRTLALLLGLSLLAAAAVLIGRGYLEEDPIAELQSITPSGGEIAADSSIVVSFNKDPGAVTAGNGFVSGVGKSRTIRWPFGSVDTGDPWLPRQEYLILSWGEGRGSWTEVYEVVIAKAEVEMVLIPAGDFQMGSTDPEALNDEQPVHKVYVDAFYMDKHEVTNFEYKRFVLENPQWQKDRIPRSLHNGRYLAHWNGNNYPVGKANHPVVFVSWYGAMAYAAWAGKRLPTEAEWEKAARGGKPDLKYPWGNTISSANANYGGNLGETSAVGSYAPNGYGLYDMAGNVWEWCLDEYDWDFYSTSPDRNPLRRSLSDVNTISNLILILDYYTYVNSNRALRGGGWDDSPQYLRAANRGWASPAVSSVALGFRCVRTVTP